MSHDKNVHDKKMHDKKSCDKKEKKIQINYIIAAMIRKKMKIS